MTTEPSVRGESLLFQYDTPDKTGGMVRDQPTNFQRRPNLERQLTEAMGYSATEALESGPRSREEVPATTARRQSQKTIDGVILDVHEESIAIACHLSEGRVRIALPRDMIPLDLQAYGTPVRIRLNPVGGMRYPVVERREVRLQEKTREEEEIDSWINSLS